MGAGGRMALAVGGDFAPGGDEALGKAARLPAG